MNLRRGKNLILCSGTCYFGEVTPHPPTHTTFPVCPGLPAKKEVHFLWVSSQSRFSASNYWVIGPGSVRYRRQGKKSRTCGDPGFSFRADGDFCLPHRCDRHTQRWLLCPPCKVSPLQREVADAYSQGAQNQWGKCYEQLSSTQSQPSKPPPDFQVIHPSLTEEGF